MKKEVDKMFYNRLRVEAVKQQYPVGTRLELISLCNDEQGMIIAGTNMQDCPTSGDKPAIRKGKIALIPKAFHKIGIPDA